MPEKTEDELWQELADAIAADLRQAIDQAMPSPTDNPNRPQKASERRFEDLLREQRQLDCVDGSLRFHRDGTFSAQLKGEVHMVSIEGVLKL